MISINTGKTTLAIILAKSSVNLQVERGQVIDSESFSYYHDLDQKLITGLDKILKRNKMGAHDLKSFKISSNLGQNSTSHKIAEAFVAGLKVKI